MRRVFAVLFPFESAGWNSVLGTFYISSVPNFILAVIPSQIHPDTLNTMTAFATGGLLSDVFLHLVPHSFMGEHQEPGAHFVMVEEKRNILVGLGIFAGFAAFFVMEKTLRVLAGEGEGGHSHSHSHSHANPDVINGESSGVSPANKEGLRSRSERAKVSNGNAEHKHEDNVQGHKASGPSKLSAYLNLFGDFVHNITDGLAMAASFYSSPLIGATTTLACFAHEIPHEIADYSILVRSGFSKRQAMQSQYLTAVGAFVSTFMGIAIHNLSATSGEGHEVSSSVNLAAAVRQTAQGLLGTTVQLADLVIPFVAGGFMYIGAVAVLPTLLEESKSVKQALREFAAMAFGVTCMFLVAWNE
ncbi:Zinc/iron permease [Fomitiporia mediterranea MF3/22]|uniref:Zinc/iron permease n=1 Tax=Fomitiporia mediterranea (strain MF3/22) TaxID=694068 RepID=UPI000440921A|nr:Zinc/iron permease [Fomitiporia mediterranea MF3/22]EJD06956.1 Zinc/iron permease [Fomitiporia mediterranea MF3/22]